MSGWSSRTRTRKSPSRSWRAGGRAVGQAVGHAERQRVRAGHDVEQEGEVAGAACHRADDREVGLGGVRRRGRRDHAPARGQAEGRLVGVDAAEVRGGAQRTGDVRPDGQRAEPGRQGRRRSAGRTARRTGVVPGVVGGAVDVVEALHILEGRRHVGLAEDHRARLPEPRHLHRVLGGDVVPVCRDAPGRGQPGDVVRLLDRHRQPEQRPVLASGACLVGGVCGGPCPVEVRYADGVDGLVVPLDTGDRLVGQFHRGDITGAQRGHEFLGRRKVLSIHGIDRNDHPDEPRNAFPYKGFEATGVPRGLAAPSVPLHASLTTEPHSPPTADTPRSPPRPPSPPRT